MKRYTYLFALALAGLLSVMGLFGQAADIAHAATSAVHTTQGAANPDQHVVVAYFTQWSIYSGFLEKDLVANGTAAHLTALDYAFGNISPDLKCYETDQAGQGDPWADYQRPFSASESVNGQADSWGQTLAGNFNQLKELKQLYPNLKILISLGGWTWSTNFSAAAEPQNRAAFVQSCIDQYILGNLPQLDGDPSGGAGSAAGIFDGFDIDWEYPDNPGNGNAYGPQDTANFTGLLAEFRHQLDALGKQTGKHYILTAALPSGQDKYDNIQLGQIGKYLDWGSLMTYDMHGPWNATGPTDFNAPLFCDPRDPSPAPANTYCINHAVLDFLAAGFPARKLVLGIPLYGHGWTNVPDVNHGLFQSSPNMQPAALGGGTANYNQLVSLNMPRYWDPLAATAWYYDGTNFWSYDDPASIALKMAYVKALGLGGAMAWSLDGDDSSGTLMKAVYRGLQGW
ncbi:MAG TPA: glycoside hydrolase family 18 protein [Ktedonobacteraceae bacterium]|nr:glycoside hydrolase family 18 protein [Ktedonobacteraceae bacterium]